MDNRTSKLYMEMLLVLREQLGEAEKLFVKIAAILLNSMSNASLTAEKQEEFLKLDAKYWELLTDIIADVTKIYPGRIRMFPVEKGDGFIGGMEKRNAQLEELERVVNQLQKRNEVWDKNRKAKLNHNLENNHEKYQ